MFHYDRGLKLTRGDLAIDFRRRQPRAFISHAHTDHMARHELALCTPATARLYQFRLGPRAVKLLPYRQPVDWGELRLTTYPAGHCLGSAMLLAEQDGRRLLYTGDFKLGDSATAERAELPRADMLVIESTYGSPEYRHTPRDEAIARLLEVVTDALRQGATPVIQAYVLGKAQEITRILTDHGLGVMQQADVYAVSQVYAECGVDLGRHVLYPGRPLAGHVLVAPPGMHRRWHVSGLKRVVRIATTGWAMNPTTARRWNVDHAIPLSDHADFDQLMQAVEQVGASEIYCTHGPEGFAEYLRAAGYNAQRLETVAARLGC